MRDEAWETVRLRRDVVDQLRKDTAYWGGELERRVAMSTVISAALAVARCEPDEMIESLGGLR